MDGVIEDFALPLFCMLSHLIPCDVATRRDGRFLFISYFLLQVVLTMLRFLALVVMVGSIVLSLYTGGEPFGPGVSGLCLDEAEIWHSNTEAPASCH